MLNKFYGKLKMLLLFFLIDLVVGQQFTREELQHIFGLKKCIQGKNIGYLKFSLCFMYSHFIVSHLIILSKCILRII